jgi:hypothetical protein
MCECMDGMFSSMKMYELGINFILHVYDSGLYTSHTCWCQPLVNGEYQHQLQWLSLAKIALKVPPVDKNRSLVANTSRCGEGISDTHTLDIQS